MNNEKKPIVVKKLKKAGKVLDGYLKFEQSLGLNKEDIQLLNK